MSALTLAGITATLKSIDYVALAKFIVPYEAFLAAPVLTNTRLLLLSHVLFYALFFGVMIWQTFLSGLTLFKALDRPTFGRVQSHLFPLYFRTTGFALFGLIVCFFLEQYDVQLLRSTTAALVAKPSADVVLTYVQPFLRINLINVQFALLISAYLTTLTQQFIVGPITTSAMFKRAKFTEEAAKHPKDEKVQASLRAANKRFGMVHGISSLFNLHVLLVAVFHGLFFVSNIIQFQTPVTGAKRV